jgi:hypothetical protein
VPCRACPHASAPRDCFQAARLRDVAHVLRWPRLAYTAKLNQYGSFYASFFDAASNQRLDVRHAVPLARPPGPGSPDGELRKGVAPVGWRQGGRVRQGGGAGGGMRVGEMRAGCAQGLGARKGGYAAELRPGVGCCSNTHQGVRGGAVGVLRQPGRFGRAPRAGESVPLQYPPGVHA